MMEGGDRNRIPSSILHPPSSRSSCLRSLILLTLLYSTGCSRLAIGNIAAINGKPKVILIRGFQDWYSTGIDRLSEEIQSHNIPAAVYRDEQWKDVANALITNHASPAVLVGFSYGADDVIDIARQLADHHLGIPLLITMDPVTPDKIPGNVARCMNFYQSNGFWDVFPWLRGVPVERRAGSSVPIENIDIRRRLDLLEPHTSHSTIAGNKKVHSAILNLIMNEK